MNDDSVARPVPSTAFVSYSWDSKEHKAWTKEFARRLRGDGVDVKLDQWEAVPGDQLPHFMEQAIHENDYVLIVCTPNYKKRSDNREGGVGYEGDIMTGEFLTTRNERKFIPILRDGDWAMAMPTWLAGKYGIDLRGDPYSDEEYNDLLCTLHGKREKAPPIGRPPRQRKSLRDDARKFQQHEEEPSEEFEPVKIVGVLVDEVGEPRNDGTRGSALYPIPFKLSRAPSREWSELFIRTWDSPPCFGSGHRPGIGRVQGDRIILIKTTMEEVKEVHRETLKAVVEKVNSEIAERVKSEQLRKKEDELRRKQHEENIQRLADDIDFD